MKNENEKNLDLLPHKNAYRAAHNPTLKFIKETVKNFPGSESEVMMAAWAEITYNLLRHHSKYPFLEIKPKMEEIFATISNNFEEDEK